MAKSKQKYKKLNSHSVEKMNKLSKNKDLRQAKTKKNHAEEETQTIKVIKKEINRSHLNLVFD